MKKTIILIVVLICACALAACAQEPAPPPVTPAAPAQPAAVEPSEDIEEDIDAAVEEAANGDVIEIKEKMFIAQCNDIYLNPDEYLGKTVKLEGVYRTFTDSVSGKTYQYVRRNSPGCCGADGEVGFEFIYDGEAPNLNDWIEAVGQVEVITEGENEYLVLRLSQLKVKAERGAEFVVN